MNGACIWLGGTSIDVSFRWGMAALVLICFPLPATFQPQVLGEPLSVAQ